MKFQFLIFSGRFMLTLLFTFLCLHNTYSQKIFNTKDSDNEQVETINEWIHSIEQEYAAKDSLAKLGYRNFDFSDRHLLMNLLSDKYFVPVFGTPYDQIPPEKFEKIGKSLYDCMKNRKIDEAKRLALDKVYQVFNINIQAAYITSLKHSLQEFRKLRTTYSEQMAELADEKSTIPVNRHNYNETNFSSLLPNEILAFIRLRTLAVARKESREAKDILDQVLNLSPGIQTASKLKYFFYENRYSVIDKISPEMKREFQNQIDQKLEAVIASLMQAEEKKFKALPAGEEGIISGNDFYIRFKKEYEFLMDSPVVMEVIKRYERSRMETIELLKSSIETKIASASKVSELESIYDRYLKYYPAAESETVKSIGRELELRKGLLKQREAISALSADSAIGATIKRQKDVYLKKLLAKGPLLNFDSVVHVDYFRDAYLRNFNSYNNNPYSDVPSNKPRYTLKWLVAAYSYLCKSSLPPDKEKIEIKVLQTVGYTTLQRLGGRYPFSTVTPDYDWVTIATFYTHPEFAYSFENFPILTGSGDPVNMWTLDLYPSDFPKRIFNDATMLISNNGCKHPGIYTILDNLNYYFLKYRRPIVSKARAFTQANGYTYNEKGNYFEKEDHRQFNNVTSVSIERNYFNAPENFAPDLDFTPEWNKSYAVNVYHTIDGQSSGVKELEIRLPGGFDLGFTTEYIDGKPIGHYKDPILKKIIRVPQDILEEWKANYKSYFIVAIRYNKRIAGILEGEEAMFWYAKGKLPSQKFQDFFKETIKTPIERIDIRYDE